MSERKDHYEEDYYGLRKKPDINTIKKNIDKRAQEMYGNRNRQNSGNTAPENRKRVPQRETQRQNGANQNNRETKNYSRYAPPNSRMRTAQGGNPPGQPPMKRQGKGNGHEAEELRKKNRRLKIISISLTLVIVLIIFAVGYFYSVLSNVDFVDDSATSEFVNQEDLFSDENVINILLVGTDAGEGDEPTRSDTMIIMSIDKTNEKIKLTSLMRDCWVEIPGSGEAKLNAAHAYGGMPLLLDTIEYNFNINIDKYVEVDFDMFVDVVNTLGGVRVEVLQREAEFLNRTTDQNIEYGDSVLLDGNEALWYCRIRGLDDDFHRTQRQRKVMTAIIEEGKQSGIFKLTSLINDISGHVKTNLTRRELTSLGFSAVRTYKNYPVEQFRIPVDGGYSDETIQGQMVLSLDMEENVSALYDFIYGVDEEESTVAVENE